MWFFKIIVNIKTTHPTYNQELKHLVKTLNSSQAAKCLSIYIGTKDRLKLHCSINVTQEKNLTHWDYSSPAKQIFESI